MNISAVLIAGLAYFVLAGLWFTHCLENNGTRLLALIDHSNGGLAAFIILVR